MAQVSQGAIRERGITSLLPWILGAVLLLYIAGFIDGSVHGAALGDTGGVLNYVHEFFHHARHVALMCH